jgi:plasmid stability protein
MGQVLVRNLDDAVIERLKARAARVGRPLEQELRAILTEAAMPPRDELKRVSAEMRARLQSLAPVDSLALLREDRER